MGDTWITDLTHFLDVLAPRLDVPAPARRIAAFFGSIASAATARAMTDGDMRFPPLPCRRKPGRKPCPGYLMLAMQAEPTAVEWKCSHCDDNGLVYNFEGTPWDLTPPSGGGPGGRRVRVMIPEDDFRALLNFTLFDRDAECAVKGAELDLGGDGVVLMAPEATVEELAGELASYLNERPKRSTWAALNRTSNLIEAALRHKDDGGKIIHLYR